ncbi:hypothetical protein ABMA28_003593 [Loxostege sticticalis]|uniref:Uncharacterized protein n=1 Tax=Loxostege sticticalis TaxID=481309 RepID=A0ABD0SWJ6_LOXSC
MHRCRCRVAVAVFVPVALVSESTVSMSKRKVIRSEGRAIIAKVFHFLQEEYNFMKANNTDKCDVSPLANVLKRTADATGVSKRTVTRILKEEKNLPSTSAKFTSQTDSALRSLSLSSSSLRSGVNICPRYLNFLTLCRHQLFSKIDGMLSNCLLRAPKTMT